MKLGRFLFLFVTILFYSGCSGSKIHEIGRIELPDGSSVVYTGVEENNKPKVLREWHCKDKCNAVTQSGEETAQIR